MADARLERRRGVRRTCGLSRHELRGRLGDLGTHHHRRSARVVDRSLHSPVRWRLVAALPLRMTRALRTTILATLALPAMAAAAQVDQQRAQEFFREAQTLCERDGGRLWG